MKFGHVRGVDLRWTGDGDLDLRWTEGGGFQGRPEFLSDGQYAVLAHLCRVGQFLDVAQRALTLAVMFA